MTIECPKCQTDNPDSQRFCGDCGTSLDVDVFQTKTLETPTDELTRGYTFADRYEIIEELGRGGMGRVFRVGDVKAKEEIALKVIKSEISTDKKTIERFRNELNTTRKIRHKNVCGMYDFGETEGTHYITMEYVAGEDLKSLIRRVKKITVETAISITKQICEGLIEAHRMGVIHRDLKPSNIMIDKSGNVRIMDFGIARSLKTKGITGTGVVIGTPEYMSPEQVEGKEADHRSDIYSLGIILFEMLTGKIPFEGDTAFAVGLKHKSEEPEDPRKYNSHIPEDLSLLILKCLEKDKEIRYQDSEELRSELTKIEDGIPSTERVAPKSKPITSREITVQFSLKKLFIPLLVFVVIVAVVFLSVFLIKKLPSEKPILPTHRQITFTGNASSPRISPDGNFIAYVNQESFDEHAIIVQDIVSEHAIEVYRLRHCSNLHWMPDSSEICISGTGLDSKRGGFIISRLGGTPRKIPLNTFFTISPDGSQFAGAEVDSKEITILEKMTWDSKTIPLTGNFQWLYDIDWSPKGHLLLFLTQDNEKNTIWTIKTDGSNQQKVVEESKGLSPLWSPEGDAIFYLRRAGQEKELWNIPVFPDTGKPLKTSSLVLPALQSGTSFSLTSDGKKFVYTKILGYSNLWLTTLESSGDSSGLRIKPLTTGTLVIRKPSISPDGRRVVFSRGSGEKANIYVMPIQGGSPTQITFMDSYNTSPVWSPDGKYIAFAGKEDGVFKVWKVSVQGGKPSQFTESEISQTSPNVAWAPGQDILYQRPGNRNLHFINPETGEETPLIQDDSVGYIFSPRYSPDGKRVAVVYNRKDGPGTWVISLDDSSSVFITKSLSSPIGWSTDGKWVYSHETTVGIIKIFMVEVESGQEKTVTTIPFTFELGIPVRPRMSPDGKNFVIPIRKLNSDVWLIENFDEVRK